MSLKSIAIEVGGQVIDTELVWDRVRYTVHLTKTGDKVGPGSNCIWFKKSLMEDQSAIMVELAWDKETEIVHLVKVDEIAPIMMIEEQRGASSLFNSEMIKLSNIDVRDVNAVNGTVNITDV